MAAFKDFEEIIAWQRAIELSGKLYEKFRDHRDYGFKDQILRASVSISNNIAEGFDRGSNREFARFLRIARSSCNEVRSMVRLGQRIGYLNQEEVDYFRGECIRESAIILALIKSLRKDAILGAVPWLLPVASLLRFV